MAGQDADRQRGATLAVESAGRPLLVLVAVQFEARSLARALRRPPDAPAASDVVFRTVGPGSANFPRILPWLATIRPREILVTGLAGGCAPDLVPGEIVLGDPVGPTAAGTWLTPPAATAARAVRALALAGLPYRAGRLLTVPGVVATPAAKADCWRTQGALAVDMESALVLAWAAAAGVPALAVRAVADGPEDALPPALLRAVAADGRTRPGAALAWVGRPALLAAAWRLRRRSRLALDRLARFLTVFIGLRP